MTGRGQAEIEAYLSRLPLFQGLPAEVVKQLAALARRDLIEAGQPVFRRGDEGSAFFVIETGTVQVFLEETNGEQEVSLLGPGDFFGEIAMLTSKRRTATITTRDPTTVLCFEAGDILPLLEAHPDFRERIGRIGARRSLESLRRLLGE